MVGCVMEDYDLGCFVDTLLFQNCIGMRLGQVDDDDMGGQLRVIRDTGHRPFRYADINFQAVHCQRHCLFQVKANVLKSRREQPELT